MKKTQLMLKIQNSIEVFENPIFGQIRMVMVDDEPMFCLIDVCRALEIKNATDVAKRLDEDELTRLNLGGRAGESNFITESGLYAVIVRSDKPNAKKFRKWVTSEVLPTIRKTGGYVNNDELFISTYLPYADENTKLIFSQTLKTVREQNETIKRQKKEIIHKEDVIIGLVDDIDLATKRQRITQIVRFGADGKYQERYSLLYGEFERKYHCNLKSRMEGCTLKPKVRNKMDYIDREMGMIPQLYEIACKLFENDVEKLKSEWESVVA
jgi:prophage antirepressor-like protein|nr:MAG TPA: repressor domain protein [Caudoviricetes sp.]